MMKIKYKSLKINHINQSSGLFIGMNVQKGRNSKKIINEGFGAVKGKNNVVKMNEGSVQVNKTS